MKHGTTVLRALIARSRLIILAEQMRVAIAMRQHN